MDGGTGQLKFTVPLPASTFSLNNYFLEANLTAGCAPPSSGAQPESTSLFVPLSLSGPIVGLDGMVYMVIPSVTSTTQCVDQNTADVTMNVSGQVQLLQVKPDGSFVFVPMDSNSFQGTPPAVLGEQPLLFEGGGVVADNENGILASWRETTIAVVPDPTFGVLLQETDTPKVSRFENGTPTYTSLLPPASVLFDQPVLGSRDPIPPGFFSSLEVAGADDTAYVNRLTGQTPPVTGIQAVDGPSGTLKWLFAAQPSAGTDLISAQQDGGVVAEEGNQVVRLDGNGQPTIDNWNVAGPCSFGFCPVNFDDIEPGDQMWFGFRDADFAFGPIAGVPNVAEDLDSTWYRPQANRQSQNAGSVVETLYLRSFARWPLFGPELFPVCGPAGCGSCATDCFRGDNRSFTTSTSVTARITGIVKFRFPGFAIVEVPPAFSDPSMDVFGRTATGHPKPTSVTRTASGGLHIEIAGANPLVPAAISPDINTKLDLTGASSPGQVCYSGHLYGDAFPDSEVFVINSQKQPTMLHTFATTADRNQGVLLLIGDNNTDMGSFSGVCAAR